MLICFKILEKDGGFNCPDPKNNPNPGTFSRHAHPEDCRKYFVCLDGNAREYGCPIGTVFKIGSDDYSGQCEDPEGVDGCENYYGDELKGLKKSQLLLGSDNGSYKSATNKPTLRKKIPQNKPATPKAVVEQQQPQPTQQSTQRVQQQQLQQRRQQPVQQQQPAQQQQQSQPQRIQRPVNSQQLSQRNNAAPAPTTRLVYFWYLLIFPSYCTNC